ncbi:calcium dependent mitochondrial carrier protein [Lineolata rhizophorae]|uniref:Mitochondrial thiamine pyrophosphate carrier 1 n=1 Tax=Lineolata rhizophorae TaxID=578093 RepID=A0A6A6PAD7_9PEZI|nr:calcium dependent mitochondrial carrier protein [Lineolata rhizophorae]
MNHESGNAQDARVESLWTQLDTRGTGHLDLSGLKKGLRKLDHPLKNADGFLKELLEAVDTNGDGRIEYSEFRSFVKETERELWSLFRSIDHNGDGKLSKSELREGFRRAGLAVPNSKLDHFFAEVDTNRDGVISYEEWRDFLLFIPAEAPSLKTVLSYYSSTVMVNPEGDVQISDETIEGLGITIARFLNLFFGSLVSIARAQPSSARSRASAPDALLPLPSLDSSSTPQPSSLDATCDATASITNSSSATTTPSKTTRMQYHPPEAVLDEPSPSPLAPVPAVPLPESDWTKWENLKPVLISFIPNSGYFIAGGLAGIVSRTSTAPLDRLKVYLIAQTSVTKEAVQAAKSGAALHAVKMGWRSLESATKELWRAGGLRSLYAGNGLNVVKVMPESAVKFGSYEASKRIFAKLEGHNDPRSLNTLSKFLTGGIAGIISQFVVYPLDTLKFRMQCETVAGGLHGNKLIFATAKKMWAQNGMRAFYRGLPMGLVGMFPYAAIDLGTFEYLKRTITARNARIRRCHEEDAQPGSVTTAAVGGFSGALGASMVYPLNLLRTRLQSQGTAQHPRTYDGIIDVTRKTIQGEGVRGLFKGLTPNLLKVVPAVSITYVVYENTKRAMNLR